MIKKLTLIQLSVLTLPHLSFSSDKYLAIGVNAWFTLVSNYQNYDLSFDKQINNVVSWQSNLGISTGNGISFYCKVDDGLDNYKVKGTYLRTGFDIYPTDKNKIHKVRFFLGIQGLISYSHETAIYKDHIRKETIPISVKSIAIGLTPRFGLDFNIYKKFQLKLAPNGTAIFYRSDHAGSYCAHYKPGGLYGVDIILGYRIK